MVFILNKNLVLIEGMQFMNSSFEKLADNNFKYLTKEFSFKNLELLKQKDACPCEYMNSFKILSEEKLPNKACFYSSVEDGIALPAEKLNGHINDKYYLTCKKTWTEFNIKNIGDYHDHYLKKDVLLLANGFEKLIDVLKASQTRSLSLF